MGWWVELGGVGQRGGPTKSHVENISDTASRVDFLPSRLCRGDALTRIVTRVPSTEKHTVFH